jgi:hypothetical protein
MGEPVPVQATEEILSRILNQTQQLKAKGLTDKNWSTLEARLSLIWGPEEFTQSQNATIWRKKCARKRYIIVQRVDAHLFLAVVLAIPQTECSNKSSEDIFHHLGCLDTYEPYHLNLRTSDETRFKSVANSAGFSESSHYKEFMKVVFRRGLCSAQLPDED